MDQFTVTAPEAGFSGESCGVAFTGGVGHVNGSSKEGRAAIEYFRRRGYTLTPVENEKTEAEAETEPFDPSEHSADDVLAYLDSLVNEDTNDTSEFDRVITAERDGKARKTILTFGQHKQEARQ